MNKVPKKPETVRDRAERLDLLEAKIRSYSTHFNFADVKRALAWSEANLRSTKVQTVDDIFSDPLVIVEELVKHAKADRETILAAIVYPSARSVEGIGLDRARLKDIGEHFGYNVQRLVKRTLRFRALSLPPPPKEKQHNSEIIALFRLMSLWAARDPRAILIRAIQNFVKLSKEEKKRGSHSTDALKQLITDANEIYAHILYIAGYNDLRKKLMDLCYKIEDPQSYQETSRYISSRVSKEHGQLIEDTLAQLIEKKFGWTRDVHFTVNFRAKSAASAREKAIRKKQLISELGDLWAARVIVKMPALGLPEGTNIDVLDKDSLQTAQAQLREKLFYVYGKHSQAYGRANKKTIKRVNPLTGKTERYSFIQTRLAELALTEPRDKDKGRQEEEGRLAWEQEVYPYIRDARFDDYVTRPKESGYSSLQDSLWIPIPGRETPVEIECQWVDEISHEVNTFGPRAGHIWFKTKLGKHITAVQRWRRAVKTEFEGRHYRGRKQVYVTNAGKIPIDVSKNPTVAGFIAASNLTCREVIIIDKYDPRPKGHTYGPSTPLPNGCEVIPVYSLTA